MRRVLFLVLALLGSSRAQVQPGQVNLPLPMPTVGIDVSPSGPTQGRSAIDAQRNRVPESALVSISELEVPKRARKELEKANQSLARQDWTQARDRLFKAISFYPAYAGAYNNLAIAYEHLGEADQERQSLEKAIALDDRFILARLNLGRMKIKQGKLQEAEAALKEALTLAPQDPNTLILLADCQFLQKHFNDAIATSYAAHNLSAPHADAHRLAARVFEQQGQFERAEAELKLFLREAPSGPAAEAARNELQIVRSAEHK